MGILNSKLFVFLYRLLAMEKGRVLAQVKPGLLNQLPIRIIDELYSENVRLHDELIKLVDVMQELQKRLATARLAQEKTLLQRQISVTDRQTSSSTSSTTVPPSKSPSWRASEICNPPGGSKPPGGCSLIIAFITPNNLLK